MTQHTPEYIAACYAAQFAQELSLPPGNLWEPPIARQIEEDIRAIKDQHIVYITWRVRLGLPQ